MLFERQVSALNIVKSKMMSREAQPFALLEVTHTRLCFGPSSYHLRSKGEFVHVHYGWMEVRRDKGHGLWKIPTGLRNTSAKSTNEKLVQIKEPNLLSILCVYPEVLNRYILGALY